MGDEVPQRFLEMMAARFDALGDPTRLAIVHALMKKGEQNVTALAGATKTTAANVSKHLRLLREAGLVARRKDGMQVFYKLDDPVVQKLCELVCASLLDEFEAKGSEDEPC
ncbi:ArsR/SmtB family transcription factor [Gemmata sp.]|uniref:ArsR/SmtB family transcription factor n=1 Tax=Gemmata sp. TaxID=1914242 RepID=UPI003F727DE6